MASQPKSGLLVSAWGTLTVVALLSDVNEIAGFFDLVSKLEPHGTNARRNANGFIYRDIEVVIENDQFKEARPHAP